MGRFRWVSLLAMCPVLMARADPLLDRPLFMAHRRAPHVDAPMAKDTMPVLTGTVLRAPIRRALFQSSDGPGLVRTVGQDVSGWRVQSIDATGVVLLRAGQVMRLHPAFGPDAPPAVIGRLPSPPRHMAGRVSARPE